MVQLDTVTPVVADTAAAEAPAAPVKDAAQTETLTEAAAALDLLATGRRHLVVGEVQQAVQALQESCAKLAAQYGETGDECGEAYLVYGAALLELGRMESGVLGNALAGAHADSEDEEAGAEDSLVEKEEEMSEEKREELSEEVLDAMTEERTAPDAETGEKPAEEEVKEPAEEAKEGEEEMTETEAKEGEEELKEGEEKNGEVKNGEEKNGEEKNGEEKNGEEEEAEAEEENGEEVDEGVEEDMEEGAEAEQADRTADEDVSNLQLAWEVLELAKLIFLRQEDEKAALKAAEAYLRLGEVGLETEQAQQAAEDFAACLALQKKHLAADSRLVAETHYQLGLALAQTGAFDEGLTSLRAAVEVLQTRVGASDADAKEVDELKALLPDILNKIEDTEEEKRATEKAKATLTEALTGAMAAVESETIGFGEASSSTTPSAAGGDAPVSDITTPSAGGDAPVSDITGIVRKKRKNDEDTSPEAKKVKTAAEEEVAPTEEVAAPAEEVSSTTA